MSAIEPPMPKIPIAEQFAVDIEDVEYQRPDGTPLLARIYRPVGVQADATVLDVHGGAWVMGDRTSQRALDFALAANGLLVAAIDFRQPPGNPYPTSLVDVNFATRWLKGNAEALGARSGAKTGAVGGSSGGHVVILSGLRPRDPRYAALPLDTDGALDATLDFVVTDAPVSNPYARYRSFEAQGDREQMEQHLSYWGTLDATDEGSPTRILERHEPVELPPLFISQGTDDRRVPLSGTQAFAARYRTAGGEVELLTFDGLGHGFILQDPTRAESVQQTEAVLDFIARQIQA